MKNANKKGFTLIEMLVVVLIIGILAAVALPQYFKAVEKSRSTEALSVLGSIAAAEERYRLSQSDNSYTKNFEDFDISFTNSSGTDATGDKLTTKNFEIVLGDDSVTATRKGSAGSVADDQGDYTITREYRSGKITCTSGKVTGICRSLGLTETAASSGGGGGEGGE